MNIEKKKSKESQKRGPAKMRHNPRAAEKKKQVKAAKAKAKGTPKLAAKKEKEDAIRQAAEKKKQARAAKAKGTRKLASKEVRERQQAERLKKPAESDIERQVADNEENVSLLQLYGALCTIHKDEIKVFRELFVLDEKKRFKVRDKEYRKIMLSELKLKLKENSRTNLSQVLSKMKLKKRDKAKIMQERTILSSINEAIKWLKIRYGKKMDNELKTIQEIKKQNYESKLKEPLRIINKAEFSGEYDTKRLKQKLGRKSKTWLKLFNEFEILDIGAKTNDEIILGIIMKMQKNKRGQIQNKIDIFHIVTKNGKIREPEEVFLLLAMLKRSRTNAIKKFNNYFTYIFLLIFFSPVAARWAQMMVDRGTQYRNRRDSSHEVVDIYRNSPSHEPHTNLNFKGKSYKMGDNPLTQSGTVSTTGSYESDESDEGLP